MRALPRALLCGRSSLASVSRFRRLTHLFLTRLLDKRSNGKGRVTDIGLAAAPGEAPPKLTPGASYRLETPTQDKLLWAATKGERMSGRENPFKDFGKDLAASLRASREGLKRDQRTEESRPRMSLLWLVLILLVGFILVAIIADGNGGPALIVIVVSLVVVAVIKQLRTSEVQSAFSVRPRGSEAVEAVTGLVVQRGFTVSYKGETTATFSRAKKANTELGCLLLLLGLVPGLIYFGLFRGIQTTTVFATTGPEGTQVILSGDDVDARKQLGDWMKANLTEINQTT